MFFPSCPFCHSNLSSVFHKSGNASFPGETTLLFFHSGPQVFSSQWPSHASQEENILWCQSLATAHKCSLLCQCTLKKQRDALSLIMFPIGMPQQHAQTHLAGVQWNLVCPFLFNYYYIEPWPPFAIAAVVLGADRTNKRSSED